MAAVRPVAILIVLTSSARCCFGMTQSCPNWASACGESPPTKGTNNMKPRSSFNPKFVLDTAFHVVDDEAQTQWIYTVKEQSSSSGGKLAEVFVDKAISVMPWSSAIRFGKSIMEACGIDPFHSDSQPLRHNLTSMMDKLKANVLEEVDETLFSENINSLNGQYTSYSQALSTVENDLDFQNILTKLSPLNVDLYTAFTVNIQNQNYVDKYAFFMLGPLLSHVSLHYNVAMLRSAAQSNLHHQVGDAQPYLMHDACVDLQDFQQKMAQYSSWFNKYWTAALDQRTNTKTVPEKSTCDSQCKGGCAGGTWKTWCVFNWHAHYTWQDAWSMLQMPVHEEGWDVRYSIVGDTETFTEGGKVTDGKELDAAIATYRQEMMSKMQSWGDAMASSVAAMKTAIDHLADNCAYSSSDLVI